MQTAIRLKNSPVPFLSLLPAFAPPGKVAQGCSYPSRSRSRAKQHRRRPALGKTRFMRGERLTAFHSSQGERLTANASYQGTAEPRHGEGPLQSQARHVANFRTSRIHPYMVSHVVHMNLHTLCHALVHTTGRKALCCKNITTRKEHPCMRSRT